MGRALIMSIIYLWSRKFSNVQQTFYFGIQFQGKYLPWVLCTFELLLGGVPVQYFVSGNGSALCALSPCLYLFILIIHYLFSHLFYFFKRLGFLLRMSSISLQRLRQSWDILHCELPFSCIESCLLSITTRLESSTNNSGNVKPMHGEIQESWMNKVLDWFCNPVVGTNILKIAKKWLLT